MHSLYPMHVWQCLHLDSGVQDTANCSFNITGYLGKDPGKRLLKKPQITGFVVDEWKKCSDHSRVCINDFHVAIQPNIKRTRQKYLQLQTQKFVASKAHESVCLIHLTVLGNQ